MNALMFTLRIFYNQVRMKDPPSILTGLIQN